jgi:anaerobic ribonucleoside-triphosphate reductase
MKTNSEKMGKGVHFVRLRRITGYLVSSLERWNSAKQAEEKDRVKHSLNDMKGKK